jgi:putative nucleotidyltransferase with HDIG domain
MLILLAALLGIYFGYRLSGLTHTKHRFKTHPTPRLSTNSPTTNPSGYIPDKDSIVEDKLWYESALEFVFKFNEALSLSLERQKVIDFLNEGARNFLYVEHSVLLLWDKEAAGLRVVGSNGLTKENNQYPLLKNEDNISSFVMRQKQPLVVNDLEKEPYLKKINKEEYLAKSFISVPLIFQDEALGVLHVCDKKFTNPFTKRDELLITNISRIGAIALQNVKLYEQIQQDYLKTIMALASAIDARDSYTMHHSENVARYAMAVAKSMGCKQHEISSIKQAALLHDIGKIAIKDSILLKEATLTPDEYEIIKQHSVKGEEIVSILSFLKQAAKLIRHHHERFDGSGYPDGLKGQGIELGSRILAVVDVFDAMTTDRPYRKAFSYQEALTEIEKNKNTQFDPEVADCLIKMGPELFFGITN